MPAIVDGAPSGGVAPVSAFELLDAIRARRALRKRFPIGEGLRNLTPAGLDTGARKILCG